MKVSKLLFFFFLLVINPIACEEIALISIAKSGSHLLSKSIFLISAKQREYIPTTNDLSNLSKNSFYPGTHFIHKQVVQSLENGKSHPKILVNIRDPRDILVSAAFFYGAYTCIASNIDSNWMYLYDFKGTSIQDRIRTYLLEGLKGETIPSPIYDIQQANQYIQRHAGNICLIKFEELIGPQGGGTMADQLSSLKKISSFLCFDLDETQLNSIASELYGGTETFRVGKIGSWRDYFDEEMKCLCKQLLGQTLIELGYESNYEW